MKLLVFEYSSINLKHNLFSEGFNMLKSILTDVDEYSSFELFYLINKSIDSFNLKNFIPIYLKENLMDWLEKNCNKYDYCLFIAPEEDLIQYNITKILEKNNVNVLGCDSAASYTCSSKYLTYQNIPSEILKINTIKLVNNEVTYDIISHKLNQTTFIIKPDNKTSSDFIYIIHNPEEFDEMIKKYKNNNITPFLAQEYISGTSISTSCLCKNEYVQLLSINSQLIIEKHNKIEYTGCESPIKHHLENNLKEISEKIIKSIPGLKGFVGIDFIIQDNKIFFVEINPRITTPYIILQKNCNENLTKSIIDLLVNDKKVDLNFKTSGKFKK